MRDSRRAPFCWQDLQALALIRDHFEGRQVTTAIAVYVAMTEIANEQRDDTFTASRAYIAEKAGSSVRTVDDYADGLIECGLLEKTERRTDRTKSLTNVWSLVSPPEREGVAAARGGAAAATYEGAADSTGEGATAAPDSRTTNVGAKEESSTSSVKKKKEEDECLVFSHWLSLCDEKGYNLRSRELTPSRRRLIAAGLKEATVEECCAALTGLFVSDWYQRRGYYELSYVFGWKPGEKKSLRERLDGFITDAERAGQGVRRVTSDQEDTLRRAKDAVRSMYAYPGNGTAQERGRSAVKWLREHAIEVVEPETADDLPTFREVR